MTVIESESVLPAAVFGAALRVRFGDERGKMAMRCRCRPGADDPEREILSGGFALDPSVPAQCGEMTLRIPPGASYRLRARTSAAPRSESGEEANVLLSLYGGQGCAALTRSDDPNGALLRAPESESEEPILSRIEIGGEIELGGEGTYDGGYEVSAEIE